MGRHQLQHQSPGGLNCASLSMCAGREAMMPASQRDAASLDQRLHHMPNNTTAVRLVLFSALSTF